MSKQDGACFLENIMPTPSELDLSVLRHLCTLERYIIASLMCSPSDIVTTQAILIIRAGPQLWS